MQLISIAMLDESRFLQKEKRKKKRKEKKRKEKKRKRNP